MMTTKIQQQNNKMLDYDVLLYTRICICKKGNKQDIKAIEYYYYIDIVSAAL